MQTGSHPRREKSAMIRRSGPRPNRTMVLFRSIRITLPRIRSCGISCSSSPELSPRIRHPVPGQGYHPVDNKPLGARPEKGYHDAGAAGCGGIGGDGDHIVVPDKRTLMLVPGAENRNGSPRAKTSRIRPTSTGPDRDREPPACEYTGAGSPAAASPVSGMELFHHRYPPLPGPAGLFFEFCFQVRDHAMHESQLPVQADRRAVFPRLQGAKLPVPPRCGHARAVPG